MKLLMLFPEFTRTFWSYDDILCFVGKKAAFTPAGLLQIAGALPESWDMRLVDLSVHRLTDKDIKWADLVFASAMKTQEDSLRKVLLKCEKFGKRVALGGPILQMGCEKFPSVSHFFLGEAEDTLPEFLKDLEKNEAKKIYTSSTFPSLANSKPSRWDLVDLENYSAPIVQIGRGCCYKCTFCDVCVINGRVPRFRPESVILAELDSLFATGYRGSVLFADDNIIGNKKRAKTILYKLAVWQIEHGYPFRFTGEFDITLADDFELMELTVRAGFRKIFLGLETFNKESLIECGKLQNVRGPDGSSRNMASCVWKMQEQGLVPMSGFIVGFDADNPESFDTEMIAGIREAGIVIAMPGVLQAPQGSKLYKMREQEGRLLTQASGNNTDWEPNFVPKMPLGRLEQGYKNIVQTIYDPKEYYKTICKFLEHYQPVKLSSRKLSLNNLKIFARAILWIGLLGGPRVSYYFWKSLRKVLACKKTGAFADVVDAQIRGVHFRKVAKGIGK